MTSKLKSKHRSKIDGAGSRGKVASLDNEKGKGTSDMDEGLL